jgi:hypothetical protein
MRFALLRDRVRRSRLGRHLGGARLAGFGRRRGRCPSGAVPDRSRTSLGGHFGLDPWLVARRSGRGHFLGARLAGLGRRARVAVSVDRSWGGTWRAALGRGARIGVHSCRGDVHCGAGRGCCRRAFAGTRLGGLGWRRRGGYVSSHSFERQHHRHAVVLRPGLGSSSSSSVGSGSSDLARRRGPHRKSVRDARLAGAARGRHQWAGRRALAFRAKIWPRRRTMRCWACRRRRRWPRCGRRTGGWRGSFTRTRAPARRASSKRSVKVRAVRGDAAATGHNERLTLAAHQRTRCWPTRTGAPRTTASCVACGPPRPAPALLAARVRWRLCRRAGAQLRRGDGRAGLGGGGERPAPVVLRLRYTLADLAAQRRVTLPFQRRVACGACRGVGAASDADRVPCPSCEVHDAAPAQPAGGHGLMTVCACTGLGAAGARGGCLFAHGRPRVRAAGPAGVPTVRRERRLGAPSVRHLPRHRHCQRGRVGYRDPEWHCRRWRAAGPLAVHPHTRRVSSTHHGWHTGLCGAGPRAGRGRPARRRDGDAGRGRAAPSCLCPPARAPRRPDRHHVHLPQCGAVGHARAPAAAGPRQRAPRPGAACGPSLPPDPCTTSSGLAWRPTCTGSARWCSRTRCVALPGAACRLRTATVRARRAYRRGPSLSWSWTLISEGARQGTCTCGSR